MKIMISVGHPGQVHLFKNLIWVLEKKGHKVKIIARDKGICTNLLDLDGFEYELISKEGKGLFGLGIEMIVRGIKLIPLIRNFNPDLILSVMDPSIAFDAKILGKEYVSLADTEYAPLIIKLVLPLTDMVLTPSSFKKDLGIKQIRYAGCHELAYLHPDYFIPNPEVLNELGLNKKDTFFVLRLIAWNAHHDVGQHGIQNKIELINRLKEYGKVFISSEGCLDDSLKQYEITISPEKLHSLLYYATLYIGEGGTTASEASILGTHSIHISTNAKYAGVFEDLHNHDLMWTFDDENGVIELVNKLLKKENLWEEGKKKREILLAEKVNVTNFMVWLVDSYPQSIEMVKRNPNITGDQF